MNKKTGAIVIFSGIAFFSALMTMAPEPEDEPDISIKSEAPQTEISPEQKTLLISKALKKRQIGLESPKMLQTEVEKIINQAERDAIETILEGDLRRLRRLSDLDLDQYPERKNPIYQKHYIQFLCAYGYSFILTSTEKIEILPGWYLHPRVEIDGFEGCERINFSMHNEIYYSVILFNLDTFVFDFVNFEADDLKVFLDTVKTQLDKLMKFASMDGKIQKIVVHALQQHEIGFFISSFVFDDSLTSDTFFNIVNQSPYQGLVTFDLRLGGLRRDTSNFILNGTFLNESVRLSPKTISLDKFGAMLSKNKLYARVRSFDVDFSNRLTGFKTPLMLICENALEIKYSFEIIYLLLQNNANPNLQDKSGLTALHLLTNNYRKLRKKYVNEGYEGISLFKRLRFLKIAKLLINFGADPTILDNKGYFPLDRIALKDKPLEQKVVRSIIKYYYTFLPLSQKKNIQDTYDILYHEITEEESSESSSSDTSDDGSSEESTGDHNNDDSSEEESSE